jgi:uncharacterized membrane protein
VGLRGADRRRFGSVDDGYAFVMTQITETIQIDVPAHAAYDRWVGNGSVPFLVGERPDIEITTRQPDERLTWRTTDGASHRGVVAFRRLSGAKTRVAVRLDFDDDVDDVAAVGERVTAALHRMKDELEDRRSPAGV